MKISPKILLIIFFLLAHFFLFSQVTFQKEYKANTYMEGNSLIETDDSCLIVAGTAKGMFLLKVNSFGDTLWSRDIGVGSFATFISKTYDGNFIVCGNIGCCGSEDVLMLKINSNGDTLWTKKYGTPKDEQGACVIQTNDGGFALTGWGYNVNNNIDLFIIKTDLNGNIQWSKTYGDSLDADWGYFISQTSDNGYILSGQAASTCYLLRLDANGNKIWDKTYRAHAYGIAYCVKETSDGGFIMSGDTYEPSPSDYPKGYLIKTDSYGDTLWTGIYADGYNEFFSVTELSNGYLIGGANAIRTDLNGDILWAKGLGTRINSGIPTKDHGFAFAGGSMRLVKTDSTGNSGCNQGNMNLIKKYFPYQQINNFSTMVNPITYTMTSYSALVRSGVTVNTLCSNSVGIKENKDALHLFSLYPNPAHETFIIDYSNSQVNSISITIRNELGQLVFRKDYSKTNSLSEVIHLSNFARGIYFVQLNTDQVIEVKKIISE